MNRRSLAKEDLPLRGLYHRWAWSAIPLFALWVGGLFAFIALVAWNLEDRERFSALIVGFRRSLLAGRPSPRLARLLLPYLVSAQALYEHSDRVLLLSLLFGCCTGLVVGILAARYASERRRIEESYTEAFKALVEVLEERDGHTAKHSALVHEAALRLAQLRRLPPHRLEQLAVAARLHDIGKVAVPDKILHKPGPPSEAEWQVVRRHPVLGASVVARLHHFAEAAKTVRHHHEHFDGTGYPDGLKGEEIPLPARMLAIADAWVAMTANRPYRAALSGEEARRILESEAGRQFDPRMVAEFVSQLAPEPPGERKDLAGSFWSQRFGTKAKAKRR